MQKNVASYVVAMSPYAHPFHVAIYTYTPQHCLFPFQVTHDRTYCLRFGLILDVNVSRKTRRDSLGYGIIFFDSMVKHVVRR